MLADVSVHKKHRTRPRCLPDWDNQYAHSAYNVRVQPICILRPGNLKIFHVKIHDDEKAFTKITASQLEAMIENHCQTICNLTLRCRSNLATCLKADYSFRTVMLHAYSGWMRIRVISDNGIFWREINKDSYRSLLLPTQRIINHAIHELSLCQSNAIPIQTLGTNISFACAIRKTVE